MTITRAPLREGRRRRARWPSSTASTPSSPRPATTRSAASSWTWHRTLLEGCANQQLLALIASLKAVIRRYEYAYMQNAGLVPVSTRAHDEIARAVERGDVDAAAPLLESNWRFTLAELLPWLEGDGR